jgi:DNA repair exonuclease SbcCD ATPase subunit
MMEVAPAHEKRRHDQFDDRIAELMHHSFNNVNLRVFQDLGGGGGGSLSSSGSPMDDVEAFFASPSTTTTPTSSSKKKREAESEAMVEQYKRKCAEVEQKLKKVKKQYVDTDGLARQRLDPRREVEQEMFQLKVKLAQRELEIKQLEEDKGELAAMVARYEQELIHFAQRAREDREQAVREALQRAKIPE